jgi:hypothetical protein
MVSRSPQSLSALPLASQQHLQQVRQPEQAKKERLGRLRRDGAHQPADVEARRTQHGMKRVTFCALQPAAV